MLAFVELIKDSAHDKGHWRNFMTKSQLLYMLAQKGPIKWSKDLSKSSWIIKISLFWKFAFKILLTKYSPFARHILSWIYYLGKMLLKLIDQYCCKDQIPLIKEMNCQCLMQKSKHTLEINVNLGFKNVSFILQTYWHMMAHGDLNKYA